MCVSVMHRPVHVPLRISRHPLRIKVLLCSSAEWKLFPVLQVNDAARKSLENRCLPGRLDNHNRLQSACSPQESNFRRLSRGYDRMGTGDGRKNCSSVSEEHGVPFLKRRCQSPSEWIRYLYQPVDRDFGLGLHD